MATISNLELNVTANTTEAKNRLEALSNVLHKFKDTSNISNGFAKLSVSIFNLNSAINGIKAPEKLTALKDSVSKIAGINTEKLDKATQGINNLGKSLSAIDESTVGRMERLASALSSIAGTNKGALNAGIKAATKEKPAEAVRTTPANSDMEKATTSTDNAGRSADNSRSAFQRLHDVLSNVMAKLSEVGSAAARTGAEMMRAAATAAWNTLRIALNGVRRVFNSLTAPIRKIIHSIGRIAFYRALRTIIKEISKGIKEGIENLARFSKLMEEMDTHNANRVMSLYASNLLYLKNAIATAIIPVLKSLEPVFDAIIKKTVDFINVLAQLFSFLSGSATYTRAKYYYIDFADSLDKASGSAGKLNKQLAQFDELNNLTTSGGSGSDNDLDYLKMFEDPIPIEDWIKNLTDGNWSNLGKVIADKITASLQNIEWDKIKKSAGSFGRNLAGFLNGFFDDKMFEEAGNGIAQALNTAIQFAFEFGDKLDTEKIGKAISRGINSFFTNFDFEALGRTLNTWAIKLKNGIKAAVGGIEWSAVFSGLTDFLHGLFGEDIDNWLKEKDPASYKALHSTAHENQVNSANFSDSQARENWQDFVDFWKDPWKATTGKTFNEYWNEKAYEIAANATGTEFSDRIGRYISKMLIVGTEQGLIHVPDAWLVEATAGLTNILNTILDKVQDFYWAKIKDIFNIRQTSSSFDNVPDSVKKQLGLNDVDLFTEGVQKTFREIGENIIEGIKKGITTAIAKLGSGTWLNTLYTKIYNSICLVFGIESPAKKMYSVGENIVLGIFQGMTLVSFFNKMQEWFDTNVAPWFSSERWTTLAQNVKTKLSNTLSYGALYQIGLTMGQGLYNAFTSQLNSLYDAFTQIKARIEGSPIHQTVTTIYSAVGDLQQAALTAVEIANDTGTKTDKPKGGSPVKTEIQVPKKPAGMPDNIWATQFEEWKKNHPTSDYIYKYAKGGFPSMGSLFVAGEVGAELVGNINGRTGVANTLQIEDAMYQAVYDATSKALSENNMSVTIEGDMDKMFRVVQNKSQDFYTRTGRPAF